MKEKTIKLSLIKQVYNSLPRSGATYEEFEKALLAEIKKNEDKKQEEKALKEKLKREAPKEVYIVIDEADEEDDVEEIISMYLKNDDGGMLSDRFFDEEIDDDGADLTEFVLVNDKLYSVDFHCEAEWISDWSVRANVPGDVSVEKVTEITSFEILEKEKGWAKVKING